MLTGVATVFTALFLDAIWGEPRRFHPLVGFGRLASWLERRVYGDSIGRGVAALLLLLLPALALTVVLVHYAGDLVVGVVGLYLALGWNSLAEHARRVATALHDHDLDAARQRVGAMVSRDTSELDATGVAKATIESVLENGNDAVFAAIFWFLVAGAPGVVLYRLSNTLDAMWGYRTTRYEKFGKAVARLDDVLNYLPARLTAASYALVGHIDAAVHCWRSQAAHWESPNAGPVMAAGAGSLDLVLGGPARYHGVDHERPLLGVGEAPSLHDIDRALRLLRRALLLWLVLLMMGGALYALCKI